VVITACRFVGNTATEVSDLVCIHNLSVCYSSNASFQTNSDTAASIGLLLCFWQNGYGGAIDNAGGSVVITGSKFIDNTAEVSHGLCTLPFCVLFFLQMLHFELALILLLLLVYCYAFESMVVPLLV